MLPYAIGFDIGITSVGWAAVALDQNEKPCGILDMLAVKTSVFPSKGEARKMVMNNGVSINKDKVSSIDYQVSEKDIMDGKYILFQKGKKNYYIVNVK